MCYDTLRSVTEYLCSIYLAAFSAYLNGTSKEEELISPKIWIHFAQYNYY